MQLGKAQIIEFLNQRGEHAQAEQAEQHLPDQVDTDHQGGLLAQHGISAEELISTFGGDRGTFR